MYNKITTISAKIFQYIFVLKGKNTLYIGMKAIGSNKPYSWRKEDVERPGDVWEQIGLCATSLERSVCDLFFN